MRAFERSTTHLQEERDEIKVTGTVASRKPSALFGQSSSFRYLRHEINPLHFFHYSYSFNDSSTSKSERRSSSSLLQRSSEVLLYVCSLHHVRSYWCLQYLGDSTQAKTQDRKILPDVCHRLNVVSTSHCNVFCSSLVCGPLSSLNVAIYTLTRISMYSNTRYGDEVWRPDTNNSADPLVFSFLLFLVSVLNFRARSKLRLYVLFSATLFIIF